ncbi:MAG: hypothetical protein J6S54_04405 [Lentisphaeria bacterium]|nr:hypothetical protein [Lentisphaeria bacterium]
MRLKQEIIEAIKAAVDDLGTQKALADISGVSCKNINKYINGGVKTIRSEAWQKLLPHIAPYFQIAPTTAKTLHDTVLCAENIAKSVEKIEKDNINYWERVTQKLAELNVDILDISTSAILSYWGGMTQSQRYELLAQAAEIYEKKR